eukprot:m.85556 g.85556  ORF g.85556 m.85556 type:complete len:413 (+) comp13017_c0_seq3:146-1384(+)
MSLLLCVWAAMSTQGQQQDHSNLVNIKKGGGACLTEKDCHFGGICAVDSKTCHCDPTWTGTHCSMLHLLPARKGSGYPTVPATTQLPSKSPFPWGGAVILERNGNENNTLYHGYFTEYMLNCPMTYATWGTQTHIRHATSPSPDGPWTPLDVAVPAAAGNPVIVRAPDGMYLLYFTNHRWVGPQRNCTGPVKDWGPPYYCDSSTANCNTGISLAYSKSLHGPWTIHYDVVNFSCTNPGAPVFAPNGTILLAYKTWIKQGRCVGVVSADNWSSFPYDHFPTGGLDSCLGTAPEIEDPSNMWFDERSNVHVLFHEKAWGGAATSPDFGRTWPDYNSTRVAYPYTVLFEDNTTLACEHREEPKVLLDENSLPSLLITQCTVATLAQRTLPTKKFHSGETQFLTRIVMQPINTRSL